MRCERANPDAYNFGLQNRDMIRAGLNALKEDVQSFQTRETLHDRWRVFATWAKSELEIKDMRKLETHHLQQYAAHLRDRFERDQISPATAQNYMSAVNRVMEIARGDNQVRVDPVREGGLPTRTGVCEQSRSVTPELHNLAISAASDRVGVLLELQREFGLRFEESAKLNAEAALKQATTKSVIDIKDGTKGGRHRCVPIVSQQQLDVLQRAAAMQDGRSLIPAHQTYKEFRQDAYKEAARLPVNFHGERHHYAQERYLMLMRAECPVRAEVGHGRPHHQYLADKLKISVSHARVLDKEIRSQVARELGHGRIDVTNSYLG